MLDDELARDDQMPLLDKTVKHLTSRKSTSRVAAIKELREAYVQGGEKRTLKELVPAVLAVLLQDEEAQIRQLAAEHVVDLAIPLIQVFLSLSMHDDKFCYSLAAVTPIIAALDACYLVCII